MTKNFSSVSVIGLGYIGLPTAAVLAAKGFDVFGMDVNAKVVETINSGKVHIIENDLDHLVHQVVSEGKLRCFLVPQPADVFIISVPTPFMAEHVPDLSYVESATKAIAPVIKPGNLVILESTSPIGTTQRVAEWLAQERPDLNFPFKNQSQLQSVDPDQRVYIAHCPERVLPGKIIEELINNDRIVGGLDEASTLVAEAFYQKFVTGGVLATSAETAELSKLTENAFRDINIAFANELSLICDQLDINVWELIRLANRHPRVNILQPGPGVGGHCIAVDPWFIVHSAPEQSKLIRAARQINDTKPFHVVEKIRSKARLFQQPSIACLGLSYKANIDDLRESPALHIVEQLASEAIGKILVVEPHIQELPKSLAGKPDVLLSDCQDAIEQAELIVLLVPHDVFLNIHPSFRQEKIIIDTVGAWAN